MTKVHKRRLEKLANHLESGKLGHEVFDFARYNTSPDGGDCAGACGTHGCALGECPIVFPRFWKFDRFGDPVLRDSGRKLVLTSVEACRFFGIEPDECAGLFMPLEFRPWAKTVLPLDASRKRVAKGIRMFLRWKEKQA